MNDNKVEIERQKANIPGLIILTIITLTITIIGIVFFINTTNSDLGMRVLFLCTFTNIIPLGGWKYIMDNKTETKYLLLNRIEDHCYEFIDEDSKIYYIPFKNIKNELEIQKIYKVTKKLEEYIIEPVDDNTLTQEEIINLSNQSKTKEEVNFDDQIKDIEQAKESVSIFKIFMTIAYIIGGIIIIEEPVLDPAYYTNRFYAGDVKQLTFKTSKDYYELGEKMNAASFVNCKMINTGLINKY